MIPLHVTAVHVLIGIAVLELVINRVAVPMLRPAQGAPPAWHTVLDYAGLFLFYFTGVLAALVLAQRCAEVFTRRRDVRSLAAHGAVAITGLIATVPLVASAPETLSLVLEGMFGLSIVLLIASCAGRQRDLGVQLGLAIVCVPLLIHVIKAVGTHLWWPDTTFDGTGQRITRAGVLAMCVAALLSPYCFAPRPFARAVSRWLPLVVATAFAAATAVLARYEYPLVAEAAKFAFGVVLDPIEADPRLALYALGVATLVWTLVSCGIAESAERRRIGTGLALLVLAGYGFRWPHHYLLPVLGLTLLGEAVRHVRDEELAALPVSSDTPPIPDAIWAAYVAAVTAGLKRQLSDVYSLTTRGEGGLTSSVIIGTAHGLSMRARIERIEGSVLALDVVVGREIDELRGSTFTIWALAPRSLGANPPGPPAAPLIKTGDAAFDERFRTRGNANALARLFDDDLRDRATTTLDGWLAYWEHDGVRYRVYPGKGAPLDHPMPLFDLSQGRSPLQPDRLIAVIELVVEIARRGVRATPPQAPSSLDDMEVS